MEATSRNSSCSPTCKHCTCYYYIADHCLNDPENDEWGGEYGVTWFDPDTGYPPVPGGGGTYEGTNNPNWWILNPPTTHPPKPEKTIQDFTEDFEDLTGLSLTKKDKLNISISLDGECSSAEQYEEHAFNFLAEKYSDEIDEDTYNADNSGFFDSTLECESYNFTPQTVGDRQIACVDNLYLSKKFGEGIYSQTDFFCGHFTLPNITHDGIVISPGKAADCAAYASNSAAAVVGFAFIGSDYQMSDFARFSVVKYSSHNEVENVSLELLDDGFGNHPGNGGAFIEFNELNYTTNPNEYIVPKFIAQAIDNNLSERELLANLGKAWANHSYLSDNIIHLISALRSAHEGESGPLGYTSLADETLPDNLQTKSSFVFVRQPKLNAELKSRETLVHEFGHCFQLSKYTDHVHSQDNVNPIWDHTGLDHCVMTYTRDRDDNRAEFDYGESNSCINILRTIFKDKNGL